MVAAPSWTSPIFVVLHRCRTGKYVSVVVVLPADVRTDDITVACDGCYPEPFDSSLISLGVQLSYPKRATYLKRRTVTYDSEEGLHQR